MNLADTGEDELIRRVISLAPHPISPGQGPGDDCAVVDAGGDELILLKTDALVENVHYTIHDSPRQVGWKAIARVVSDFAAMGGHPSEYMITLALPSSTALAWVEDMYRGMASCMERYGGLLVGGETTSIPKGSAQVISISGMGRVRKEHLILRSGGKPGDILLVTGSLGGSLAGKHLNFEPRMEAAHWLAKQSLPHAMMDLSDGLAKDLPRLAEASGCGFLLERQAIPRTKDCTLDQALNDGEDFELLLAIPPDQWIHMRTLWSQTFPFLPLSRIGTLVSPEAGESLTGGWDHFTSAIPQASG
jgi:thiamine-monophosphate kinase